MAKRPAQISVVAVPVEEEGYSPDPFPTSSVDSFSLRGSPKASSSAGSFSLHGSPKASSSASISSRGSPKSPSSPKYEKAPTPQPQPQSQPTQQHSIKGLEKVKKLEAVKGSAVEEAPRVGAKRITGQRAKFSSLYAPPDADGARTYLAGHGWSYGMQSILLKSCEKYPLRFFIVDDSGR